MTEPTVDEIIQNMRMNSVAQLRKRLLKLSAKRHDGDEQATLFLRDLARLFKPV